MGAATAFDWRLKVANAVSLDRISKARDHLGRNGDVLATYTPGALQRENRWSRAQIEQTVARLMREQLGIETFDWNQRFVDDLGVQ